jgi:hypothetical protein
MIDHKRVGDLCLWMIRRVLVARIGWPDGTHRTLVGYDYERVLTVSMGGALVVFGSGQLTLTTSLSICDTDTGNEDDVHDRHGM